ncbi:arylsulfotransferase [Fusarium agapanthi]|uniref:Arylsulfotransferase n=1 Tax=Fusarium agapanthi TaxID=1803897 RepID=A0A9P5BN55_9HYPO|nr:arylsulfotransferase [Fusarium agapanthi]
MQVRSTDLRLQTRTSSAPSAPGSSIITSDILRDDGKDKRDATIKKLYVDRHDEIDTSSQGSYQDFSNGNVLLGCGNVDHIKEFGPEGDFRMSMSGAASYRVHREVWDATPAGYRQMQQL